MTANFATGSSSVTRSHQTYLLVTMGGIVCTTRSILAEKDVTLANGLPGVILDMQGPVGLTRTLITVLNGNVIYVSGYGNLEKFETSP